MQITGPHIHYYLHCHRQLWLFANSIQMEHTNEAVSEGKLIHETTYMQRPSRYEEIQVDGISIDFYDTKNKVIHEIKKSAKLHEAHIWQVKYYIYVLEKNGIEGATGLLEYPTEHRTEKVDLSDADRVQLIEMSRNIENIVIQEEVPALLNNSRCKSCSYFDFCYINEDENA